MAKFTAKILVNLFDDMINQVRFDLMNDGYFDNVQKPYFHYGTTLNMINELLSKDNAHVDKFPLVYLSQPFTEDYNTDNLSTLFNATVEVFIINHTDPNHTILDRYNEVFEPILYPIYESLMNNITHYRGFMFDLKTPPRHSKEDLPHWGDGQKNFDNDFVDAIRITNLVIPVSKTNC